MKKFFFLLALTPAVLFAQKTNNVKTASPSGQVVTSNQFVINGNISGIDDNTNISLLNPNNGAVEASSKVIGGKFTLSGSMPYPDFRLLGINSQPPFINLFLDNSNVTITGKKDGFEMAAISGSPSHKDFAEFMIEMKPYDSLFSGKEVSENLKSKAIESLEFFIGKHKVSYITPLAIYRHYQLTDDADEMEKFYNALIAPVKSGPIGNYIAQMIADNKKIPVGKPLADFSQEDPDGKMISLSSFKGKYVLVDFWASWCGPCRMENPNVVATYNKYKDKNFTVFGVSLDKDKTKWLEAVKADNLTWMHVSDLKGWQNAVAAQFGITSIPQNILIDPQGNVVAKNLRGPALEATLASVIK